MTFKVCIVGAGAIGGLVGARLAALADAQVSALARGATLAALRQHGWRLHEGGQRLQAPARAEEDAGALGAQDLVVIAVKGPSLPALAPRLAPLIGPGTVVLPAMNGVPWWFSQAMPALHGEPLASVDPGGVIGRAVPFEAVLGCVVHVSSSTSEPGVVQHRMGQGLIIGEPLGQRGGRPGADGGEGATAGPATTAATPVATPVATGTARVRRVAEWLRRARFEVTVSADVKRDAWYKLWGNLTMNPVSALTGATIDRVLADELVRGLCSGAMREAARVGERIGCPIEQSPEDRHAVTAKLGAFKTSMLQDVEAGRAIELDAIVGAVHEIARRVRVDTPVIDGLLGLTRLFARMRGLYPD
ncbi:MAG: 2-dehydropantoate 2-reductase [Rubrivivax sp.]|nr:2-dehydropantoate 2-reductase [Rubrivivax sp.]